MNGKLWRVVAVLCAVAMFAAGAAPAGAQMSEVKEKPPMYSYVGFWNIPRGQWAEMAKSDEADKSILDKAIANGTIMAYGHDVNMVHQPDQQTHDEWWSAMSMAGCSMCWSSSTSLAVTLRRCWVMPPNTGMAFMSAGTTTSIMGPGRTLYTHGASYKLKADAPNDAVERLSKNLFVPFFEKLLADGAIHEYEVDTEAIHTEDAGRVLVFYLAANAEALDKVNAALAGADKGNPLMARLLVRWWTTLRTVISLVRTNATYK